jgi:simple sugar transport system permease protein
MAASFFENILIATVPIATALLLPCLGEIITERSGVLNLSVEGVMLSGALVGYATTAATGSPYAGLFVAALAGLFISGAFAFLTISLKTDQVVTGLVFAFLGIGLTTLLGEPWTQISIDNGLPNIAIPLLADLPLIGRFLFQNTITDYLALLLIPAVWYFLFRTNLGLEIRFVGQNPEVADTAGVSVTSHRYLSILIGGVLASLGGAHLSLAFVQLWAPGIVGGRGWIAIALVIFSRWNPSYALLGAYLFAFIDAVAVRSQLIDLSSLPLSEALAEIFAVVFNPTLMTTYPYVATLLVLIVVSRQGSSQRSGGPSALMDSYVREGE